MMRFVVGDGKTSIGDAMASVDDLMEPRWECGRPKYNTGSAVAIGERAGYMVGYRMRAGSPVVVDVFGHDAGGAATALHRSNARYLGFRTRRLNPWSRPR